MKLKLNIARLLLEEEIYDPSKTTEQRGIALDKATFLEEFAHIKRIDIEQEEENDSNGKKGKESKKKETDNKHIPDRGW